MLSISQIFRKKCFLVWYNFKITRNWELKIFKPLGVEKNFRHWSFGAISAVVQPQVLSASGTTKNFVVFAAMTTVPWSNRTMQIPCFAGCRTQHGDAGFILRGRNFTEHLTLEAKTRSVQTFTIVPLSGEINQWQPVQQPHVKTKGCRWGDLTTQTYIARKFLHHIASQFAFIMMWVQEFGVVVVVPFQVFLWVPWGKQGASQGLA